MNSFIIRLRKLELLYLAKGVLFGGLIATFQYLKEAYREAYEASFIRN